MNYAEIDIFLNDHRHEENYNRLRIKLPRNLAELLCQGEQAINAITKMQDIVHHLETTDRAYEYAFSGGNMSDSLRSVATIMADAWRAVVRFNNEDKLPTVLDEKIHRNEFRIQVLQNETEKLKKERAEYGEPDTPEGCYEKDDHLLPKKRPLNKRKEGGNK